MPKRRIVVRTPASKKRPNRSGLPRLIGQVGSIPPPKQHFCGFCESSRWLLASWEAPRTWLEIEQKIDSLFPKGFELEALGPRSHLVKATGSPVLRLATILIFCLKAKDFFAWCSKVLRR